MLKRLLNRILIAVALAIGVVATSANILAQSITVATDHFKIDGYLL